MRRIPRKDKINPPFKGKIKLSKVQAENTMEEIRRKNQEMVKMNIELRKTVESQKEVEKLFLMIFLKELTLYQITKK